MHESQQYYYNKIAESISYLEANFAQQPNLEQIAKHVNISPFHFQKMFSEWVGVSPKKFLQFISTKYAKQLLNHQTLAETAYNTGLSGTGRLHDMFINIEGMTPGEYKNGGKNLRINYHFSPSLFGEILIASTSKGICNIEFSDEKDMALKSLQLKFPSAEFRYEKDDFQDSALSFFQSDWSQLKQLKLHLKGSKFQLKVWDALLKIPTGKLKTYGQIAHEIGNLKASRAVGTATGNNPVAYLIPCHRVIQQSGELGGYHWNPIRKKIIIGWEAVKTNKY